VAHPKRPAPVVPGRVWAPLAERVGDLSLLLSVGALPPQVRRRIGLPWAPGDDDRFERQVRRLRAASSLLPELLLGLPPAMPYLVRARLSPRPAA